MTLAEMNWARGYVQEARYLRSLVTLVDERPTRGWAHARHTVKQTLRHWAVANVGNMGDAQKGMVDALLDSVGC